MATLIWRTEGAEALVAYCARVSSPNQDNPEIGGLLRYLIGHSHWSPFEMVSMCVEIVTTRAISPQILRHRSFSFQEFSQRYSPVKLVLRVQGGKRQSSAEAFDDKENFTGEAEELSEKSLDLYDRMIASGVALETARSVLPLSTPTRLYMSGTLRSWIHYLQVRCQESTQKEHRDIALEIRRIFTKEFPVISAALGWAE